MKGEQEILPVYCQQPVERERLVSRRKKPGPRCQCLAGEKPGLLGALKLCTPAWSPNPTRVFLLPVPLRASPLLPFPSTTPTRAGAVGTRAYSRPRSAATMAEPEQADSSSAPGRRLPPVPSASPPLPGPCPQPGGPSCALLTRSSDPPPGSSRSP